MEKKFLEYLQKDCSGVNPCHAGVTGGDVSMTGLIREAFFQPNGHALLVQELAGFNYRAWTMWVFISGSRQHFS